MTEQQPPFDLQAKIKGMPDAELPKFTEWLIMERYRVQADKVQVKMPKGDFMPVDGRKIRSFFDEEDSVVPSHTDPQEIEKRLVQVGLFGGNDGAVTFVGPDGRFWVGYVSDENIDALKAAGYKNGAQYGVVNVNNIMNAGYKFVDPQLQEQWEQWGEKLFAEQQAKSLIPPEKREVVSEEISGTTTVTVASLTPVIDTPLDIAKRTDKTEPVEPTTPETKLITSIEQLQLGDRVQMVEPDGRRHPPFIVTITEARNKSVHGIDPLDNKSRFASLNWTEHLEKVPFSPGEAIPVVVVGQVTAGDRLRVTRPDGKIKEWTVGRVGSHGSMFIQPEESGQVGIDLNFLHGTRVEKIPAPS